VSLYLFEHDWEQERHRLDLLEQIFDPVTIDHLGRLPLESGGRVLEVGGGAGSITRWLCNRVGPEGLVVSTDLDTDFLEQLRETNLEVRRHDIVNDELEEGAFDLIHSRLVLDHLPDRDDVVKRMAAALRPGGWLIQEVFDWGSAAPAPGCPAGDLMVRAVEVMRKVFHAAGATDHYGRRLPLVLRAAGLAEVGAEGRVLVALGGTPVATWWQLSLARLRGPGLATGLMSAAELDELLFRHDDVDFCFLLPTLVTAWGRRPG
jgi:SAM-dependent methyltransferase